MYRVSQQFIRELLRHDFNSWRMFSIVPYSCLFCRMCMCSRKGKFCVIINVKTLYFMYFFVSLILCNHIRFACHRQFMIRSRLRHMECSRRFLSRVLRVRAIFSVPTPRLISLLAGSHAHRIKACILLIYIFFVLSDYVVQSTHTSIFLCV